MNRLQALAIGVSLFAFTYSHAWGGICEETLTEVLVEVDHLRDPNADYRDPEYRPQGQPDASNPQFASFMQSFYPEMLRGIANVLRRKGFRADPRDFVSNAYLRVCRAWVNFHPSKGRFRSYVRISLREAVRDMLRESDPLVDHVRTGVKAIDRATEVFIRETWRTGVGAGDVDEVLTEEEEETEKESRIPKFLRSRVGIAKGFALLNYARRPADYRVELSTLLARDTEEAFEGLWGREVTDHVLEGLTAKEETIVWKVLALRYSNVEVAREYDVDPSRISQILSGLKPGMRERARELLGEDFEETLGPPGRLKKE